MSKKIIKNKYYIKNGEYNEYSFVCEIHFTKKDNIEIFRKIISIKNIKGIEIISEVSLSMKKSESNFKSLLKHIFRTMGVGIDQHIIPRTLIKNWNIVDGHNKSNLIVINREKKYNKITEKVSGYDKFMSKDFYFVRYYKSSIVVLETGFISVLDDLLTKVRQIFTESCDFNELLSLKYSSQVKCYLIDKGNNFYNKLLFLYFFHWAISHDYEKCQYFIGILSSNIINYDTVDNIISSLVYSYKEEIEKYASTNKIFLFKIDDYSIAETPLGNLFSLNIYYGEQNKHFSVSPLSPSYYLVITNDLDEVLQQLAHQENIDSIIKKYILHNIIDYYEKNFIHFVYKSDTAKKYLETVLDGLISDLVNDIGINFPLEYYNYTIRELIEDDILDTKKIYMLNLKYENL